jgi:hypothetical protein
MGVQRVDSFFVNRTQKLNLWVFSMWVVSLSTAQHTEAEPMGVQHVGSLLVNSTQKLNILTFT